jgi:hypothetical protein
MKLAPAKLGAEPKKMAILGGLVVLLAVVYFLNRNPDVPQQQASPVTRPAATRANSSGGSRTPLPPQRSAAPASSGVRSGGLTSAGRRGETSIQDFKPTLKLPEGTDVSRIDPSLKLELLAKLQQAGMEGGERSLFEFGAEPRPKTPTPSVQPVKPQAPPAATPDLPSAPVAPAKPPVPPIPLKFYGYVNESQGPAKRAFFLDGEDIVVAGENDTIRNRYKVIRIGVNSAVVEDTTNKNQQTLPLIEELPG